MRRIMSSVACPGVHYLKKNIQFSEKKLLNKKRVLIFSTTSEAFLIRRITRRDIIINVHVTRYSTRYSCQVLTKLEFSRQICEKYSNCMKIPPLGAELFHEDGRTDRHDVASRFSQFCEAFKNESTPLKYVT
jgi:hypothetical protein